MSIYIYICVMRMIWYDGIMIWYQWAGIHRVLSTEHLEKKGSCHQTILIHINPPKCMSHPLATKGNSTDRFRFQMSFRSRNSFRMKNLY